MPKDALPSGYILHVAPASLRMPNAAPHLEGVNRQAFQCVPVYLDDQLTFANVAFATMAVGCLSMLAAVRGPEPPSYNLDADGGG